MQKVKLGEICEINMGQSPESQYYNNDGNGIPFFQGNADFGEIYPDIRVWCTSPKKISNIGDILISVRAPIGALNLVNCKCCIGRGLVALTPKEESCNIKYIWYVLQSKVVYLQSKGSGSTFKAIGKSVIEDMEISLPPLEEQRKIAEKLDKVSKLIDQRKEQLTNLDLLIKSQFDNIVDNCDKLTERKLIEICNFIDYRGKTPTKSKCGVPLITAKNVKNHYFSFESAEYVPAESFNNIMTRGLPCINDVLFTTEAPLGNVCRIPNMTKQFCVGQRLITMQPQKQIVTAEFLEYSLTTEIFKEKLTQKSSGSTVRGIRSKYLAELTIPLPPIELQNKFAEFVERVDKLKSKVNNSLTHLTQLKQSLMQQYFN